VTPELFPQAEIEEIERSDVMLLASQKGDNNLTRTAFRLISAIVEMRGQSVPMRRIATLLHCSTDTVLAVERAHPQLVRTAKERSVPAQRAVSALLVE
jgi:hypothetical protein